MEITKELIEKAKAVKSAEELLTLAKENNLEMAIEEAESYFATLNPTQGELADDELDNVSGGGCEMSDGTHEFTVVTSGCPCFTGKFKDNFNDDGIPYRKDYRGRREQWKAFSSNKTCGRCMYLEFKNGDLGYCGQSGK